MWSKNHLEPYIDFVKPFYAGKDSVHDFRHIERIISRLTPLSEGIAQSIRTDRLFFLACFHGLGKQLSGNPEFCTQVRIFLNSLDWSKEDIEEAFQSLFRHLSNPQSIEEKIDHEANCVETLGAFGIAKAFTTGGAKGQSIEETVNIFEHQHLDKVVFQTPAGKQLAGERKTYTKEFLRRLRDEW